MLTRLVSAAAALALSTSQPLGAQELDFYDRSERGPLEPGNMFIPAENGQGRFIRSFTACTQDGKTANVILDLQISEEFMHDVLNLPQNHPDRVAFFDKTSILVGIFKLAAQHVLAEKITSNMLTEPQLVEVETQIGREFLRQILEYPRENLPSTSLSTPEFGSPFEVQATEQACALY